VSTTHLARPLTTAPDPDALPAHDQPRLATGPAVTAGPVAGLRGARAHSVLKAALLSFICVALVVIAIGLMFHLEVVLTWVAAIYTEIVIPLAAVALIRHTHPSWAIFPRAAVRGRAAGRRGQK
jgi:hypothetical protein